MSIYAASRNQVKKNFIHPNWIFFLRIFLFCWWFSAVNDLLSFFLYAHNYSRVLHGLAFACLLSLPSLFIRRLSKAYLTLLYIVLWAPSALFFMHLLLFKRPITGNAYDVIFEAPLSEALEFLVQNGNTGNVLLLFIYSLIPFLLFIRMPSSKIFPDNRIRILFIIFTILLADAWHAGFKINHIRNDNYFLDLFYSHEDYIHEKDFLKKEIDKRKKYKKDNTIQSLMPAAIQPVLVFVIGESITKNHMQLYGYGRNTNKLLNTIKNNLYIFDSVFSPSAHTIPALRSALSFSTRKDTLPFYRKKSIIELLNDAGYETFWISNQKSLGIYETQTSIVAGAARHTEYISDQLSAWKNEYDESLFAPFTRALKSTSPKKAIFLHLIGAHEDFKYRYPAAYTYFVNAKGIQSPFAKKDAYKINIINTYDNAILYNDFIVKKTIELTSKYAQASAVLAFSDHGEEVYDDHDLSGHAGWAPTKNMYEIPFILWASDSMKRKNESFYTLLNTYTHRGYCTEDLIHSIIDLGMLRCKDFDSSKSIFSMYYQNRPEYLMQIK